MKFMLNEQELEEHLTKEMYDELPTCKVLWDQLKFSFGGTSTTRLRSLVIKFEEYTKDPKHTMSEHLRVMSNMIGKLRDAGHALTYEQQVRAVIRSLPASWANMKQILTHSENIKNFFDVSQHVILEAETRDADKTLTYVAQEGSRNAIGKRGRQNASKNLDLYELEEVEATLPSPSEGGELVPHPVVAEDSISDPQPSGSIPDSGSTPQGPLGQQDSQLRRGARGRVPHRRFEIVGEILMCTPNGRHYESDWAEKLSGGRPGRESPKRLSPLLKTSLDRDLFLDDEKVGNGVTSFPGARPCLEDLGTMSSDTNSVGKLARAPSVSLLPSPLEEGSEEFESDNDDVPVDTMTLDAVKPDLEMGHVATRTVELDEIKTSSRLNDQTTVGDANKLSRKVTGTSKRSEAEGCTILDVMNILGSLPGVTPGDSLFMLGTRLFIRSEEREMFVALGDSELRLQWLRQEQLREDAHSTL
ncbi:hypothetical protein RJ640_028831 [Escallonia rubra]|uniref:Uncharacterized protein n=1 Tax=Escallonia rubra TaxID=112253 RepID=A0AA88RQU7_9ASTE|nr:hypothetical protein RJ640_028831 [Escallonia rubra]